MLKLVFVSVQLQMTKVSWMTSYEFNFLLSTQFVAFAINHHMNSCEKKKNELFHWRSMIISECVCVSAWRYHMQSFHLNTKNCYRLMRYDFVLDMCDFGNWSLSTLIFFHPKTHTLKPIYQTTPIFTEAFSKVCVQCVIIPWMNC